MRSDDRGKRLHGREKILKNSEKSLILWDNGYEKRIILTHEQNVNYLSRTLKP